MSLIQLLIGAVFVLNSALAVPVQPIHVSVDLVAEQGSLKSGEPVWIGFRFQMEPGWHIYWRNPGDSGTPTKIIWKELSGAEIGEIQWPRPERMVEGDMVTYGYSGAVLLMARLIPPTDLKPDARLHLVATASWLACKGMCVPGKVEVALDLPAGDGKQGPNAPLFVRTRTSVPVPMPPGMFVKAIVTEGKLILTSSGTGSMEKNKALFFPFVPDQVSNTATQTYSWNPSGWTLILVKSDQLRGLPGSISGVLTSGRKAWEIDVPISSLPSPDGPGPQPGKSGAPYVGLWWSIVLAFIGGIILNLMPCVFPVLSIKVLGFVRESSHHPHEVKLHGLLYGLGVIVSFWALALTLILLRAGGQQLGWGFQLQSPVIILLLTVVMFLLSLNLLGVFEVGTTIVRATGKFSWHEGRIGAFFTGVLATLLATPCTAPFMGTAIGFAATQPPLSGLGIFTALGLGMAAPYVALSFAPHLSHMLPKPGRWMETFKQLMAFPLLATVIWLLWVLGRQAGQAAIMSGLGCLFISGFAGWLYGRWHTSFMRIVAVILIAGGVILSVVGMRASAPLGALVSEGDWQVYSPVRLEQELGKGNPVFVDFTAAWCLTCKVNEMAVLNTSRVMGEFRRHKVVLLRADWTNSSPEIEKALAGFGRNGVPLYLLYPGRKGSIPRILPQILTPQSVRDELDRLPKRD